MFVLIGCVQFKRFAIAHFFHNQQFAVISGGIGGDFSALVGPGTDPHFAHCIIQVDVFVEHPIPAVLQKADIVVGTLL